MGPLDNAARKRGGHEMQRSMTVAQRVFRKIASGRFKERALQPISALDEACKFRNRLEIAMEEARLSREDCATGIVFVDADFSGLYSIKLSPGEEARVLEKMMQIQAVTVGLVIAIRDRERDERIIKAYPFLKGNQALQWLSEVLDREETARFVN